ncbi:methyltransferase domain-containing protein [Desulfonema magnum]|uniref:D-alanine--D-alanine ligase domain-containing protein n=1 Tax=Desulfonema magnum TaxID=45655 RepID=A0A975GMA5_9BACT|nr:methyltransferase domain-containing protein [Desulfonema magnum]QTA86607.1 D-alanine--D-alanine ligase domain-containing protein [Desulfonema magnum]
MDAFHKKSSEKASKQTKSSKAVSKSLGPVSSLEDYVHPEWWRHIFNALYLKTDADVVEDTKITRREADTFINVLKLTPEDTILDLCCGQGRHVLELAQRGFKIEGLDRSRYLIQKAKALAKKENLHVRFREGDVRKLPYPADKFEVVTVLGNSFGYFEAASDDHRVLREIFRVLTPWGRLLLDVTDGEYLRKNFQARSWEWVDRKHFVCRERSLSAGTQRLISREVITDITKGVIADQFYAERLYNKDELITLLEKAGFSNVEIHGEMLTDSVRNQDLGMMEKRITVTAQVRKEWTPVKKKARKSQRKNFVVLFGDPNKPDPLKPCAVFDDDDFYTIDQLKSALRTLKGYNFKYLTNHNTVIQDLQKLSEKPVFVLNLCDEGYNNDPRMELHIPALLDMLNIPYTGSSSQCLAFCYDKSLVRGIAKEMGIPVPQAFFIEPEDTMFNLPFSFPVIVKPNFGDSSFGITQQSVTENYEDLINAISIIREKFGYEKPILVEEFLTGKDLSVGIIGNSFTSYTVLPITEEDYSEVPPDLPRVCGYEAKWLPDSPYFKIKSVPANLPDATEKYITECCMKLLDRLECRDYTRMDWRLDAEGNPRLLEVNPNPGWCWDGHLAKMAKFAGISYAEMLEMILQAGEERIEQTRMTDSSLIYNGNALKTEANGMPN